MVRRQLVPEQVPFRRPVPNKTDPGGVTAVLEVSLTIRQTGTVLRLLVMVQVVFWPAVTVAFGYVPFVQDTRGVIVRQIRTGAGGFADGVRTGIDGDGARCTAVADVRCVLHAVDCQVELAWIVGGNQLLDRR